MDGDEYLVYDEDSCDVRALRAEVARLDNEVSNAIDVTPSLVETGLQDIYKALSEKYGISAEYKDFKSFIRGIADQSKLESAMNEALGAKVTSAITKRTKMKLVISMNYLVDRIMDLAQAEANSVQVLTPEAVGMIDRCMQWYQTLTQMENEINVIDPDRTMESIVEKAKGEIDSSVSNKNENIGLIRQLTQSLKDEAKLEGN